MLRQAVEAAVELSVFAQMAMVLFLVAAALIVAREWMRPRREVEHGSRLPLNDGTSDPTE